MSFEIKSQIHKYNMNKKEIIKVLETATSKAEALKMMNIFPNTREKKKLKTATLEMSLDLNSIFKTNRDKRYKEYKTCPVCKENFLVSKNTKKKSITCSYACSNKFFRSGENNGNWKEEAYRTTCFLHHDKMCVVCGEKLIVEVHHYDENKQNNSPENLIPLCPTHHQYLHSRHKDLVQHIVDAYRIRFIENNRG